ncbi:MAG: hypothetical protein ABW170_16530 [Candidatus Thiodiazotropha sp. L084R]
MINENQGYRNRGVMIFIMLTLFFISTAASAARFNLNVVDGAGNPVEGFRWMIQEDTTFPVDPAAPATTADELLSLSFHRSYAPVGKAQNDASGMTGNTDLASQEILNVTPGRYYVSVLPYSGHSISGGQVTVLPNADDPNNMLDDLTVIAQAHPIPTAQISIYLFHDNYPINGAPDLPEETNPAPGEPGHVDWTQFNLFLEEPGGRYGIAGGQVIQDAFGNYLGTSYREDCGIDGLPDADVFTNFICYVDGAPIVETLGNGTLQPNEDGLLLVKNLAPGKYGVIILPPGKETDEANGWQQTSTIEGSKVIDAWVKANEPAAFVEFGPPGPHVFVGFVKSTADGGFPPLTSTPGEQVATVSGTVSDIHLSRPPFSQFYAGRDFPGCWVGVNDMAAGGGFGVFATPCTESNFSIPGLSPGSYQLVVFDTNLDAVISLQPFSVDSTGGTCNLGSSCDFGNVGVFNWFSRVNGGVFSDADQDGFWDPTEAGIGPDNQDITLRWRDGSVYQNFPTDGDGLAPFDEKFPFFHWLVAEVSFASKKATGATFVVDAGGPVDTTATDFPSFGELVPQAQCTDASQYDPATNSCVGFESINPNTGDNLSRTETGAVLTQGIQGFLGQVNVLQFGKTDYISFTEADFTAFPPVLPKFVGENGGISGMVFYATTRAENEPQFAAAEEWEPGMPRVQLALYADGDVDSFPIGASFPNGTDAFGDPTYGDVDWNNNGIAEPDDGVIDDIDLNGCVSYADVDNYPFGNFPGNEDVDYNWSTTADATGVCIQNPGPGNGVFDLNDALQVTTTDSWDDSIPEGCQGRNNVPGAVVVPAIADDRCFDGLRNYNQLRDAVFDGGFAFTDYDLDHLTAIGGNTAAAAAAIQSYIASADAAVRAQDAAKADNLQLGMLPSDYIVQMSTPPGYENLREEHKNVDFGDDYIPGEGQDWRADLQALPPSCVGEPHVVPQYLTMVTKDGSGDAGVGDANLIDPAMAGDEGVYAPYAGVSRPLCDMKQVPLSSAQNAAAEFFVMTHVPKAGNISGVILNDLANEFDPSAPAFGEKYAPPHVPVAFFDWNGDLVSRVYADENGRFDALVPSTSTANLPMPSGMSPNMLVSCMNDAGPIKNPQYDPTTDTGDGIDANGQSALIIDPYFDRQYSQFCYTFQYMPGVITYLDTPVVQVAAFAGPGQFPVDCERPDSTPMISSVKRRNSSGGGGPFALPGQEIRINSMGNNVVVPNPEWDGIDLALKTTARDYRFSAAAEAWIEDATGNRSALTVTAGNGNRIFATVPAGTSAGEYQLTVVNSDGAETPIVVTLTVGVDVAGTEMGLRGNGDFYNVVSIPSALYPTIQSAIGNPLEGQPGVEAGDLILVAPGVYDEMVIMYKPVKLQGWGAGAVTINARKSPTEKIIAWRALAQYLVDEGSVTQTPGQVNAPFGFPGLNNGAFPTEEGAGVFVAGIRNGINRFGHPRNRGARIDDFTIIGASTGGGIIANGFNQFLHIANNRLTANSGFNGGGIRIGHPDLTHVIANENDPSFVNGNPNQEVGSLVYDDAVNDQVRIHHNHISQNGTLNGAGGGISLNTGSDSYRVQKNLVCGNFSQGGGGGIAHQGISRNGLIEDNTILFNETFRQTPGSAPAGGGILVTGLPALIPEDETGLLLSPGTGHVTIDSNLIRGNLTGAGDGSGIMLSSINGQDIGQSLGARGPWYRVLVYNNMIDNNVAGVAGALALLDSPKVFIRNNTVANNDSTATGSQAFAPNSPNLSTAMPAGIVSRYHSDVMDQLLNLDENFGDVFVDPDVFGSRPQGSDFSDPVLRDSIVYHNRSFFWTNFDDPSTLAIENSLVPVTCDTPAAPTGNANCDIATVSVDDVSRDLAVLNGLGVSPDFNLNPRRSLLLAGTPYHANNTYITGDPGFANAYFNVGRSNTLLFDEAIGLQTAAAFDEGGNFIQVAYGPLSLVEPGTAGATLFDYHLAVGSPAINGGGSTPANGRLSVDFDNDPRTPQSGQSDIGADEMVP